MARHDVSDLAQRLGCNAEAVCRPYLSNGRRQGNYWQVGDVRNTAGPLHVCPPMGRAKGAAGKWTDAAGSMAICFGDPREPPAQRLR